MDAALELDAFDDEAPEPLPPDSDFADFADSDFALDDDSPPAATELDPDRESVR